MSAMAKLLQDLRTQGGWPDDLLRGIAVHLIAGTSPEPLQG